MSNPVLPPEQLYGHDGMCINIENASGQRLYVIRAHSDQTVYDVKMKIHRADERILPEMQRLSYQGRVLADYYTLSDQSIQKDAVLKLTIKI